MAIKTKPKIRKLGTVDLDMVEINPLVIGGRLYRFESVRGDYHANKLGYPYFRFIDTATGEATAPFAPGHNFGSAFCHDGVTYVFGVLTGGGTTVRDTIKVFRSGDLTHWEEKTALKLPGWGMFNTSVCEGKDGFVMAFEIDSPQEECGVPFTIRFAVSKDLWDWELTAPECVYAKDRYTACPVIRYLPEDGYYYMIYLEHLPGWAYAPYIARSADLATWKRSPVNPVMIHEDLEDKKIANPHLTKEQREYIENALDINNSDVDLCEYQGRTIINYSWGNQFGCEFLAEAVYEGGLSEFLRRFFEGWNGPVDV